MAKVRITYAKGYAPVKPAKIMVPKTEKQNIRFGTEVYKQLYKLIYSQGFHHWAIKDMVKPKLVRLAVIKAAKKSKVNIVKK